MRNVISQSGGSVTLVDLGTGTSFDVSSYPGYQNFTVDNFMISGNATKAVVLMHSHTQGDNQTSANLFSYDANTGKLSVTNYINTTVGYSYAYVSISEYHVFLAY